jgi:phosphatidylinositol alpha-1,6-mannosyltransferase
MDVALAANSFRKKILTTKILQNAHRVIANSEFTANLVSGFGVPADRITMLPPCPQALTAASDSEVHATRELFGLVGKKVILSVGRLVLRKGFDTLVEAMPEILKTTPSAILVIAGEGNMSGKLVHEAKKRGVEGSVRFVGGVDKKTLAALYQSAHVFAMPCRGIGPDVEGFGTVYLEAGQFGVPSVAGKSGGASEAVINGKTGLVVEPTVEATAHAIIDLLTHEDKRAPLGEAAQIFAQGFSWKHNVQKLMKLV